MSMAEGKSSVVEVLHAGGLLFSREAGYLTAGLVFQLLVVLPFFAAPASPRPELLDLMDSPVALRATTAALLVGLAVSYLLGHVLLGLAFIPLNLTKPVVRLVPTARPWLQPGDGDDVTDEMKVLTERPELHTRFIERYNLLYQLRRLFSSCTFFAALVLFAEGFLAPESLQRDPRLWAGILIVVAVVLAFESFRTESEFRRRLSAARQACG